MRKNSKGARHSRAKVTKVKRDGREIAPHLEYKMRIIQMHKRDRGLCCLCGKYVSQSEATFEHKAGRGMGGGKRDDRIEGNGIAHAVCNQAKGSMSFAKWKETHPEAF